MFQVSFTIKHLGQHKPTIAEALEQRLGRTATHQELVGEVKRILSESAVELAGKGELRFQR